MIKIRLDTPPVGPLLADQTQPHLKQTPHNSGIWGDYHFFVNVPIYECDYWVVFEQIEKTESCYCAPQNTIFITGEPDHIKKYNQKFLNQFSHIISGNKNITHRDLFNYIQGHWWFVNKNYDELSSIKYIEKTKEISIVTSNKTISEGHRKRYEFALKLKEHFGNRIDLFGDGIKNFKDKWDVLAPYKYSVIIENCKCDNYLSEKLFDCYLTHTFPFYFGCRNVSDYYNKNSYIEIDLDNIDHIIKLIEDVLSDTSHYEKSLPYIIESKDRTLNLYNIFPLIIRYIELKKLHADNTKTVVTIMPEQITNINIRIRKFLFTKLQFFKSLINCMRK